MYVVIIVALLAFLTGAGLDWFIRAGPFPFVDKGFRMFIVPPSDHDEQAQGELLEILAHFGLKPLYDINSPTLGIRRVLMSDKLTSIYRLPQTLWEELGRPAAVMGLPPVRRPQRKAEECTAMLREMGYQADIWLDPDPDVPKGRMALVRTNIAGSTPFVFRRHFFRMGPRPPRWK
jgi:hypothetical protein